MRVYVVGFQPSDDRAAIGGFDWFYQSDQALEWLKQMVAADVDGETHADLSHSFTFLQLEIPDKVLNGDIQDWQGEITDWISGNIELIEVSRRG